MTTAATGNLLMKQDDPRPLYYRLKELLKHELVQEFKPHQRFWSVRELVQRHGVSTITVTRALRELVSEGYLTAQHGKGMFVKPQPARVHQPASQVLTISLPMKQTLDQVLLQRDGIRKDYLRGIADAAQEHNVVLEFQLVPAEKTMNFFLSLLNRESPHGIVLYGSRDPEYPRLVDRMVEWAGPYVLFQPERYYTWQQVHERGLHYVTTDQQSGLYQATRHLIQLGHRRIAFWQHMRTAWTRLEGYRQAMREARLPIDENLIQQDVELDACYKTPLKRLIQQNITALVTASDHIAIKVLADAQQAGIDIPGQLSVTGFDDTPLAAACNPPLTTVTVDRYLTGRQLTLSLARQFQNPESQQIHQVMIPVQLVCRESTTNPCT